MTRAMNAKPNRIPKLLMSLSTELIGFISFEIIRCVKKVLLIKNNRKSAKQYFWVLVILL